MSCCAVVKGATRARRGSSKGRIVTEMYRMEW